MLRRWGNSHSHGGNPQLAGWFISIYFMENPNLKWMMPGGTHLWKPSDGSTTTTDKAMASLVLGQFLGHLWDIDNRQWPSAVLIDVLAAVPPRVQAHWVVLYSSTLARKQSQLFPDWQGDATPKKQYSDYFWRYFSPNYGHVTRETRTINHESAWTYPFFMVFPHMGVSINGGTPIAGLLWKIPI